MAFLSIENIVTKPFGCFKQVYWRLHLRQNESRITPENTPGSPYVPRQWEHCPGKPVPHEREDSADYTILSVSIDRRAMTWKWHPSTKTQSTGLILLHPNILYSSKLYTIKLINRCDIPQSTPKPSASKHQSASTVVSKT